MSRHFSQKFSWTAAFFLLAGLFCLTAAVSPVGAEQPLVQKKPLVQQEPIYRIGPSDLLEIVTWREEQLTRKDVLVRPDGRISLPLTDDIMAAGLTLMQLKYRITKALSHYLEAPQVYVVLTNPRHWEISVLGNVKKEGNFQMLKPTDVMQALSMAGGFNEWANKDEVFILRGIGPRQQRFLFEYSEVINGEKREQNIILKPGDIIVVP
ncbi:MAG: polysaccharide export protein [Proteobacteria bacterium]|nr:polysaccharide export protein [Pseudomonadota bacterium]MBU4275977.1 polysaccharide export protein [Pseudomonadota bacterium]MBU4384012.1 polysaccharide export protein [Pseudomonadota bacterium]MBU4606728.1 polysaccharide export protein [Pseudomonadota bacterium]MCG2763651.1 polysaccharide export protein [Desulfarculaceae bacterium]